ncbi:hypothetical protein [Gloeobacter violaceus]|uniref:Gll1966 protein n=1 Tax=Gloeobacter violaceus (strain ATCC 29082 / PCC 7421) TaxID=251221 RepID=Q7NJ66_GLOVI|nr:hypothetical protein [Gloeobacter violaceus]BAC89907.1 gll1966 [Gloeobacter violaceus PCC 7421]
MGDRTGLLAVLALLVTVLAGLGPALGLSPAIAAFLVAVGLGSFFIDQFFLQGRLSVLLVGLIQERRPGWRERVARHEAGHLLVAHRLGLPVEGYTLGAWESFRRGQGGGGGVILGSPPARLGIEGIESYCATWLAGALAERMYYSEAVGAVEDQQKVGLLLAAAQRTGAVAARTLRNRAERRAAAILDAERQTHNALAERMLTGQSLERCLQLLNSTKDAASSDSAVQA